MKRLLAAGGDRRSIRSPRPSAAAKQGSLHNPEFTMVEWYRVGDDYAGGDGPARRLAGADPRPRRAERLTFAEAFRATRRRRSDIGPCPTDEHRPAADRPKVQPHLGPRPSHDPLRLSRQPVGPGPRPPGQSARRRAVRAVRRTASSWPTAITSCSTRRSSASATATNNAARAADGKYTLPEESRLLAAMDHGLPACSGCALGFDRLVMVATGAKSIQEVMAFPIERA